MRKFFCFLTFFFNAIIFASTYETYQKALQEKEPNNLFDECVNIITGSFVFDDEIIANGKEPIKLKRSYFSLNNFDKRSKDEKYHNEYILAGWSYDNLTKAFFYGDRIDIVQPSLEVYSFGIPYNKEKNHKKKDKEDKSQFLQILEYQKTSFLSNFSYKEVKSIDPKDLVVKLSGQNELFILYPDGTQKYYKKENNNLNEYLLRRETLLNQNKIEYFYDGLNRLKEIRSTNPKGNKVYAWIKFNYFQTDPGYKDKQKDKYDFYIVTSDGKKYEFRHNNYYPMISNKKRSEHPFFILEQLNSNQFNEKLTYHLDYKRTHPLLKSVSSNKKTKEISYYFLGKKNSEVDIEFFDINDFRFERVKTLQEPIGINGSLITTYKFFYENPSVNKLANTTVYDFQNNKYVYYYNLDYKLEKIQRFENKNGQYFLLNEQRFVWEKIKNVSLLISKSFLDKNLKPVFAKRYFYDNNNNLIEEKIYGNISGNSSDLVLDERNLPKEGSETFSKKYKYTNDKRNLLIEELDDSNLKITYTYLPATNILESKIVSYDDKIKKRNFYEYDDNNNLIKEIEDDSSSFNKNEISNITYRKIKYFYLKSNDPFIGCIQSVEEKYLDLKTSQEKLIKKEVYSYSDLGKIIKKDIYDENNGYAYFLLYEYDEKGNLISEVNQTDKKFKYEYDLKNNKIKEILPNGTTISNTYNQSNQIIRSEIQKEKEAYKLQYFYDVNKNKIAFIDDLNSVTFEYDNFLNLTKQVISKLVDGKNSSTLQTYSYDEKGNINQIYQNDNVTKISYNIYSNPILIIYPDGTQEKFVYNLDGSLKIFIDKDGIQTHFTYDFLKRITSKKAVSSDGKILQKEDYKYNSFAQEQQINKKQTIKYYFDFAQRPIKKEIICNGDVYTEAYFYDSLSRKNKTIYNNTFIEIIYRDLLDRIIAVEKTDLNGLVFYKKEYEYDDLDNLSIISYIDDKKSIEKHYFDSFQRISKIEDAAKNETIYKYDNALIFLNKPTLKTDEINAIKIESLNEIEKKLVNENQNLIFLEKKDSNGNTFYKEENYFDKNYFDYFNNLFSTQPTPLNPVSMKQVSRELVPLDPIFMKLVSKKLVSKKQSFFIDGKEVKREVFYSYDNMNRLVSCLEKTKNFEKETKYTYTNKGYIKSVIKPDGITIEKEYDDFGNILKISSSDKKCEYSFEYNDLDLPIKITDLQNNLQVVRKYNNFGGLIEEKLANNLEIKKEYDLLGRKTALIYPDNSYPGNSCIRYIYNPFYLQKVIRQIPFGQNRYYHEYLKYDLSGNVLQERLMQDLGIIDSRLEDLKSDEILTTVESFKKYDSLGKLEKINWKIFLKNDASNQSKDFNRAINETKIEEEAFLPLLLSKDLSQKISYDQNGNIISCESENEKILYTYDSLDRLIQIKKDDYVVEFLYDGLNRKIIKNIYKLKDENKMHISTFKYLYDDMQEIGIYNEKNEPVELKILGREDNNGTKVIAYEKSNEIFVPLYDVFGNLSSLVSFQGLVEAYKYSSWCEDLIYSLDKIKYSTYFNPLKYLEKKVVEDINLLDFNTIFYEPIQRKTKSQNPINMLFKDSEISLFKIQMESTKEKNEITSLDVSINNPFKGFDLNLFSIKLPNDEYYNKENIRFSKEAVSFILQEKIPLDFILEAIKNPKNIEKTHDFKFWITYKTFKFLIDMQTKEILCIERN